ncbi:MAG: alkaline phosphatase family protein, partial [Ignavibacteriaceae bacterium]
MNKQFVLLFFIFINSISYTQSASKPKLIITITVDQLGEEVLSRYKDYYKNGLKKLLNEGVYYSNAMVDHAITNSLPGHTSIATGMLPRNHGLIDNMWGEISGDSVIQIMPTRSYQNRIVGYDSLWGYSPDYLEAKTLAQNISEANNESKIISVGSSVSAALHMGKQKGLAVWYHPPLAEYVSSDYYLGTLPIWLNKFNDQLKVKMNTDTVWNKKYSVGVSSAPIDERSFENNGKNFLFPHHSYESGDFYRWINATPFIDKYTTDLVIQSIINEKLGDDINTDFLSISYSMIDHVGHFFGPYSLEQFENLMSLDEQLGIL